MKKILITAVICGCLTTATPYAGIASYLVESVLQDPKLTIDQKVAKMDEIVKLTDEQKTKYKDYLMRRDKEKIELKAKTETMTEEEKKKAQKEFKEKYSNELKKILSPEQMKKLEESKDKK
jgi:hypothetical protein